MQQNPNTKESSSKKKGRDPLMVVFVILAIVTVGIVAVAFKCIEDLQDNSASLRKFKVKSKTQIGDSPDFDLFEHKMADFDERKQSHPETYLLARKGMSLTDNGKFQEALDCFAKSSEALENDVRGKKISDKDTEMRSFLHDRRGVCLGSMGDLDKALAEFNIATQIDPKFANAYCDRAHLYELMGKRGLAQEEMRKMQLIPTVQMKDSILEEWGEQLHK